jgi:hypothetical protein
MVDAASAGFGVPVYATCLVTSVVNLPGTEDLHATNYRVCAVIQRCTMSADRRIGANLPPSIVQRDRAERVAAEAYFCALNNVIWCMSLKRRINLDVKFANLVDTYPLEKLSNSADSSVLPRLFLIDLDSTTYRQLPGTRTSGAAEDANSKLKHLTPSDQGWRPIYLYNALIMSVQLRIIVSDQSIYHELWWDRVRRPLQTLLAQLKASESETSANGYDEEYDCMCELVREIKWTGPLPSRELPDLPEIDNSPKTTPATIYTAPTRITFPWATAALPRASACSDSSAKTVGSTRARQRPASLPITTRGTDTASRPWCASLPIVGTPIARRPRRSWICSLSLPTRRGRSSFVSLSTSGSRSRASTRCASTRRGDRCPWATSSRCKRGQFQTARPCGHSSPALPRAPERAARVRFAQSSPPRR